MQFNKSALLTAINHALSVYDSETERFERESAEWYVKDLEAWHAKCGQQWTDFFTTARRALRNGKPITESMLPRMLDGYRGRAISTYERPSRPAEKDVRGVPYLDVVKLQSLKAALEAINDDTVTPNQLSQLGYKQLEWLFKSAVIASAKGGN